MQKDSDEAQGIKQKKMEIIPLRLVSVLLFVTIRTIHACNFWLDCGHMGMQVMCDVQLLSRIPNPIQTAVTLNVNNFFLILKQTLPILVTFSKNYLATIRYDMVLSTWLDVSLATVFWWHVFQHFRFSYFSIEQKLFFSIFKVFRSFSGVFIRFNYFWAEFGRFFEVLELKPEIKDGGPRWPPFRHDHVIIHRRHETSSTINADAKGDIFRRTIYSPSLVVIAFIFLELREGWVAEFASPPVAEDQKSPGPVQLSWDARQEITRIIVSSGNWLWKPANFKGDNKAAAIYVGRATPLHNLLIRWNLYNNLTGMFLLDSCSNTTFLQTFCGLCRVKARNDNKSI